ncbi:MAG TPA: electron transfer flavoprotein subunit alpha/FixB family protein [Syntrophorhabdaceae bacterium]|nr:electron transfer flavoprotein subunit alpha/FixB family protein [Syntrophorhabdaceae bacterium]
MSYTLIVAEVRRGVFEERNLDSLGLGALLGAQSVLLVPDGAYQVPDKFVDAIVKVKAAEEVYLNPMNMGRMLEAAFAAKGKPDHILFTQSSSGMEAAAYAAGLFGMPVITDVSGYDRDAGIFLKSYYSDKVFGQFKAAGSPAILTVRSGSFREFAAEKTAAAAAEAIDAAAVETRTFVEYVEEEKTDIDITKAEFLLSVGRGVGNQGEVSGYEELAGILKAVLSGSRPVIDKMWLPKARQVGTSGKTVKPKVYLAMGISGAFQHIAGMKDSDCIIAVNKDPEAPIFQYAHYGIVGDIHKVRDKLKELAKG